MLQIYILESLVQVVFKAMGMEEIIKEGSVAREEKRAND